MAIYQSCVALMVRLTFRQWQSAILVMIAITCILLSLLEVSLDIDNPIILSVMVCTILILGVPHGALDYSLAVNGLKLLTATQKIRFLLVYIGIVLFSIGLWLISPIIGFLLFMLMSVWHFSEDWSLVNNRNQCWIMAICFIATPALFKPAEFSEILVMLWLTDIQIELVTSVSQFIAIVTLLFLLFRFNKASIGLYIELVALLTVLMLGGILHYFTAYFCIVHSPLYVKRFVTEVPTTKSHLIIQLMAVMCATFILLIVLWWLSGIYQFDVGIYAWIFIGLFALTVPHMLLVEKCFEKANSIPSPNE